MADRHNIRRNRKPDAMTKKRLYSPPTGLRATGPRTVALIVIALVETSIGAGPVQVSEQKDLVSRVAPEQQNKAQSNPCLPSVQPQPGIQGGEFLPSYLVRSVAHSSKSGRKYVGYHSWCEVDPKSHGLRWESDALNAMNDFMVCRYNLGDSKEAYLDFRGAQIEFANKDGSGKGEVLALAVYEGPAPAILFKGNTINFGKPLFGPKKWSKVEQRPYLSVDPFTVPVKVRAGVKEVSVVLVGMDSWIDTKVTIRVAGIKMIARPASAIPVRKK